MEHKGVEYRVLQTLGPKGWKWTVDLGGGRSKSGTTVNRTIAIRRAIETIDRGIVIPRLEE